MAKLSTTERKALPDKAFVFPGSRSYPIQDKAHGEAAVKLVGRTHNPSKIKKVDAAVHSKYPSISITKGHIHGASEHEFVHMQEPVEVQEVDMKQFGKDWEPLGI